MDHIKIFAKQRTSIRTIISCSFHKTKIPDKSIKDKTYLAGFWEFQPWFWLDLENLDWISKYSNLNFPNWPFDFIFQLFPGTLDYFCISKIILLKFHWLIQLDTVTLTNHVTRSGLSTHTGDKIIITGKIIMLLQII